MKRIFAFAFSLALCAAVMIAAPLSVSYAEETPGGSSSCSEPDTPDGPKVPNGDEKPEKPVMPMEEMPDRQGDAI